MPEIRPENRPGNSPGTPRDIGPAQDLVVVRNLRKTYGATVAVDDVSLTVRSGEIFGILGPNGAGKTTTVESIAGLRAPDSGTVRVTGLDPRKRRAEITSLVGVQLQASELPDKIKAREALELYASFYPAPRDPGELLEQLGLAQVQNTAFAKLSGGQKQRLSIALALIGNPRIAILDELTTGLDPQARRDTWELVRGVRDAGVTILLVTHFMEEAEYLCDRIAIIDGGRVVALDTPAGLIAAARSEQRISFRLPGPLTDHSVLTALPAVHEVTVENGRFVVTGNDDLLVAVVTELAARGLAPLDLHTEQTTLDEAFLTLSGRTSEGADR
ncbi:ABC transporter related protein [Kribbella flavida DSM 17836]|uniref:ABC transporter related protein n=1 Tax=Kribbella flavida (strain DSM 17836 / JCM 10339 / NBRC 14399) TaxID=479435 RepID=D2PRE7_KRIFD|nr:ABC transporter ATP-binding protein [Kribbella flavida]ADB34865.1 ABC transporter related protein [Kribbella flavida DSM 17836]